MLKLVQGQNKVFTFYKEKGIAAITTYLLSRTKADPFTYVDLNAGCGWNEQAEVKGSPLIFMETAEKLGRGYRTVFLDSHKENTTYLEKITRGRENCQVLCMDTNGLFNAAELGVGPADTGFVMVDPNGFEGLRRIPLLNTFPPSMDVVVSWNSNSIKRRLGVKVRKDSAYTLGQDEVLPMIDSYTKRIRRRYWLVRKLLKRDKSQWTMLVGSNRPLYDIPSDGFVKMSSPLGKRIVHVCSTLYARDEEVYFDYLTSPMECVIV